MRIFDRLADGFRTRTAKYSVWLEQFRQPNVLSGQCQELSKRKGFESWLLFSNVFLTLLLVRVTAAKVKDLGLLMSRFSPLKKLTMLGMFAFIMGAIG